MWRSRLQDDPIAYDLADRLWREIRSSGQPASHAAPDDAGRFLRALLTLLEMESQRPADSDRWTADVPLDAHRALAVAWQPGEGWSASAITSGDGDEDPLSRAWTGIGRIGSVEVRGGDGINIGKVRRDKPER